MDCSTPGLPVPHRLLEFAQIHVHCIGGAIQAAHPLTPSSPLPSIFPSIRDFSSELSVCIRWRKYWNISASALVLPVNIQGWYPLRLTGFISLLSKGLSGVFSSTIVRRHWFFGILPSLWSSSHNHTWPLGRPKPWLYGPLLAEWYLWFSTHCV